MTPQSIQNAYATLLLLVQPLNGLFSRTTWVSRNWISKTSLDLNEARDDGVLAGPYANNLQITTPTPHHSIFTGRMLFLTPNQQCQSTRQFACATQRG